MGSGAPQHPVILPLGATIQKFPFHGHNLVLSWPTSDNYRHFNSPFFGETIGRVANRISNASIDNLNGRSWQLPANNGRNCLHGGKKGWGKQVWDGPRAEERAGQPVQGYRLLSRHGDQGFPGTVEARAWYSTHVSPDESETVLEVEYEVEMVDVEPATATTTDEQEAQFIEETVVALTNHSYFNITDGPTIEGTTVSLATNLHQAVDAATKIPTGAITPFPGIQAKTPFELAAATPVIDHCFILDDDGDDDGHGGAAVPLDTRTRPLRRLVTLSSNSTHTTVHIDSTEPAFQVYTGDGIDVPAVQGQDTRGPRAGIAIEPCRYVNAVNTPAWRHMVLLKRGQLWGSRIRYTAIKT